MGRQDKQLPRVADDIEVTPEMIEAGAEALVGYSDATASIEEYLPDVYRAMLAAYLAGETDRQLYLQRLILDRVVKPLHAKVVE